MQSGLGIAALPEYMLQESTNLVQLLPELQGPRVDAFFVYPEELRQSSRIVVFRDFILRNIAEAGLSDTQRATSQKNRDFPDNL